MNRTSTPVKALQYLALAAYILFLGFQLLWLVSASIKSSQELAALDMSLLPKQFHWDNYGVALQKQGLTRSAVNSLIVSLLSMVLVVLLSMPAAYALARFKGRLRAVGVGWILVSQVFPVILIIIPLFIILRDVRLVDTLMGLVLVPAVRRSGVRGNTWMPASVIRKV